MYNYCIVKNLAAENFDEFGNLLRIRQSFIHQLLIISEKAIETGLISAKVFFAKQFAKVFSRQNFLQYGSWNFFIPTFFAKKPQS